MAYLQPQNYSNPRWMIGGNLGKKFEHSKHSLGLAVEKIQVWAGKNALRGCRITYSNGERATVGKMEDKKHKEFVIDLKGGERVTHLAVYGNGGVTRCGAIHIKTNKKKEYFPKMGNKTKLKTENKFKCGGGLILGILGRHGSDLDAFGFLTLRHVKHCFISDVKYNMEQLPNPVKNLSFSLEIPNESGTDSDNGSVAVSMRDINKAMWTNNDEWQFGQKYEVKAGVPYITGTTVETSWNVTPKKSQKSEWDLDVSDKVDAPVVGAAKKKTGIEYCFFGTPINDLKYTAKMTFLCELVNEKWTFKIEGKYNGADFTKLHGVNFTTASWDDKWCPVEEVKKDPKPIRSHYDVEENKEETKENN